MSDDKLEFLSEQPEEAETAQVEAPEPLEAEEKAEAPEPEPQEAEAPEGEGEPKVEPPATSEEKPAHVPITALLDEREKRQAAEREAEQLRQWRQQQEQAARQGQKKPDFFDDPDKAMQQSLTAMKVQQSKFLAERDYGAELVQEAMAFFDTRPMQESAQFIGHPSPVHAAVEYYKRQKFLDEVKDPDEWRKAERERLRQEMIAEAQATPRPAPTAPPPSVAKAPSSGRSQPSVGSGFDAVFPE